MAIESASFDLIRDLVRKRAAIVLDDSKQYLVEARLKGIYREEGLDTIEELAGKLKFEPPELVTKVVEALTTNETSFFRDIHPFDAFRDEILPPILERRRAERTLDIWCAASSSGQEPLSIAMILRENFPELGDWNVRILATDINQKMIERCREGKYNQIEVSRGLPAKLLVKYFNRDGAYWKADDALLSMIDYQKMNLVEPFRPMRPLDVVFLRNVLIYFSPDVKASILKNVRGVMRPEGALLLGTAESTMGLDTRFTPKKCDKVTVFEPA